MKDNTGCGYLILTVLIMPVTLACMGFTLHFLWAWFIVPLGVKAIGIAHSLGIILMARAALAGPIKGDSKSPKTSDEQQAALMRQLGYGVTFPALALGIGWVYHSLM